MTKDEAIKFIKPLAWVNGGAGGVESFYSIRPHKGKKYNYIVEKCDAQGIDSDYKYFRTAEDAIKFCEQDYIEDVLSYLTLN